MDNQAQAIRFPTITKLLYFGDNSEKRKQILKTTRSKIINDAFGKNDIESFKVVILYSIPQVMNICTMKLAKKSKQEQNDDQAKKQTSLKPKNQTSSQTGINFNIKRRMSERKLNAWEVSMFEKNFNFKEFYSQIIFLMHLVNGIQVPKSSMKVRKGRVDMGNNGTLVKYILKKRSWWSITSDENSHSSLLWNTTSENIEENNASYIRVETQQQRLIFMKNIDLALKLHPKMFKLFFEQEQSNIKIRQWFENLSINKKVFSDKIVIRNKLPGHSEVTTKKKLSLNLKKFYQKEDQNPWDYTPKTHHITSFNWKKKLPQIRSESNDQTSLWLLKPGQNTNQGKGITIFKTLNSSLEFLGRYPPKNEDRSYILQQYITPLLYESRKFDIRCFVLGVQIYDEIRFYWYEEGYARTASEKFSLKKTSKSIHLTNDSIQKRYQKYDKYESGNKLSYSELEKYLLNKFAINFSSTIHPLMKKIARDAFKAGSKIGGSIDSVFFEIFGLDFILEKKGRPFLLEVNTNPSLEVSCNLLSRIIPELLENTFRLVLDVLFPGNVVPGWAQNFILQNKFSLLTRRKIKKEKQCQ